MEGFHYCCNIIHGDSKKILARFNSCSALIISSFPRDKMEDLKHEAEYSYPEEYFKRRMIQHIVFYSDEFKKVLKDDGILAIKFNFEDDDDDLVNELRNIGWYFCNNYHFGGDYSVGDSYYIFSKIPRHVDLKIDVFLPSCYDHPLETLINSFSNKGDLIIDPFADTGDVGIAAIKLRRDCILIDSDKIKCESMYQHITELLGQYVAFLEYESKP